MLIKNCDFVVTQSKEREILRNCDVKIRNDKIIEIGENLDGDVLIDGKSKALLPGLINCHTHLAMTFLRGYADDMEVNEWLQKKIWPMESKLTKEKVYEGSLLGCKEMIRSGTTCFNDMYLFMNETARAVEKSGLRAVLCSVYFDFTKEDIFSDEFNLVDKFKKHDRIKFVFGPHAPYSCSKELLIKSREFMDGNKCGAHIHVAESKKEIEDLKKKYGKSPVELLNEIDFLNDRVLMAHGIWLSDEDIEIIKEKKVKLAHCPVSNMKLASGVMRLFDLWKNGIVVGLGTDGCASNNNLDMFEEMKFAALLHKIDKMDSTVAKAQEVFDMATLKGAEALNMEKEIGSIEIGKKADLITLNLEDYNMKPVHDIVSNIVYSANGGNVNDVIVNGKVLMKDKLINKFN